LLLDYFFNNDLSHVDSCWCKKGGKLIDNNSGGGVGDNDV